MKTTVIQLIEKTQSGVDPYGEPIYTETTIDVPGVLVGSPTTDDIQSTMQLFGKHIAYSLGIPKGDEHEWEDREVIIWGGRFRTIGFPKTGEQENIPLKWGKVVQVERYG